MTRTLTSRLTTFLFAAALAASGVGDLVRAAPIAQGLAHLGYPDYFPWILGFWKVAGVAALLLPVPAVVKEWASAGFFFALTGAAASHLLAGDPVGTTVAPLVLLGLGGAAYALRAPAPEPAPALA